MSDKFNGFSQEEIKKINAEKIRKMPSKSSMKQAMFKGHGILRMPDKRDSVDALNKHRKQMNVISEDSAIEEVDLNKSLSKSIEEALFYQPLAKTKSSMCTSGDQQNPRNLGESLNDSSILKIPDDCKITSTSVSAEDSFVIPESKQTPDVVESPFRGISLKDFEMHRKLIQEQNKQKKQMLHKAIEQHSQKTAAEARKIEEIKSELAKLDNDLALDVALLRKQIDHACVVYSAIEKNYVKIEAQFLKAKLDFHNASEKKELLTEHLCTVIAHNEDRKAQKLSELMEKVGINLNGDVDTPRSNGCVDLSN